MKQEYGREWSAVEVEQKEAREPLVSDIIIMDKSILFHGVVCFKTIKCFMKGEDFEKFITEELCPRLDATKVVGMDNLNCHKRKGIIEAIEKTGARVILLTSIQ